MYFQDTHDNQFISFDQNRFIQKEREKKHLPQKSNDLCVALHFHYGKIKKYIL